MVHSWHRFDLLSYDLASHRISHSMLKSFCRSFSSHMCLLSSVFCRLVLLLKLCLCPLNLSLNSFFVSPMYVLASSLPSRVVTDALYITDFVRHFPFSGHWLAFLQLHVFSWCFCISFLLLLSRFFVVPVYNITDVW